MTATAVSARVLVERLVEARERERNRVHLDRRLVRRAGVISFSEVSDSP